jgi:hypothetical protein
MRRIDLEYDLPQFVAANLVRKIAANDFRLPSLDRDRFPKIPDHVIARIEQIVRDAYIEGGEDVGGDVLSDHLWQQALAGRRAMIANGELIAKDDFRPRLGVTERRLDKLLADGSVFAFHVDEVEYFPALLTDPTRNQERLRAICRIIQPAPPASRLAFIVSPHGSLGDRRPMDLLENDEEFAAARRLAASWAAEWWRTVVTIYQGEHEAEPHDVSPLYTAMAEIDPRRQLWARASEALHAHGYEWPLGPYPDVRKFSVFVVRQAAGHAAPTPETCVQIVADDKIIRIRIVAGPGATLSSRTMPAAHHKNLVDIAKRVIAHLANAKRA